MPVDDPNEYLRTDPHVGPLVEAHGPLYLETADDLFERLVISILRQQVSMASAAATRERLFDRVEVTPEGVLDADPDTLRDAGLSRQKTRYVRNAARTFRDRGYDLTYFEGMDDAAVVEELTSITGVGEWTANMQLLFSFGRPDVFPVGDLGVRKGMATLFDLDRSDRERMVELARRWAPYRSYATLYLWRIEEDVAEGVEEVVAGGTEDVR